MSYDIIQYPALPTAYTPTSGRDITLIVMHETGGVKTGDLWTLSGRDRRRLVSVHYYVTKLGEIYQLVQDKDIAWHAGESAWEGETDCNRFSIGIEMENLNNGRDPYPQVQLDVVRWLVREKIRQYNVPRSRLVRHAKIALPPGRKTDPERTFPWDQFVSEVYMAEPTDRGFYRRYRVKAGGATVRQAWWRNRPGEPSNIAAQLAPGALFEANEIKFGETIDGSDEWVHLADQRGFVHAPAVEQVSE